MKRSEIAKLVTVIWAAEGYPREPSEEDVALWSMFANEGGWESYDAAMRAYVVARTEQPHFRMLAGMITEVLAKVRHASSKSFDLDVERPPDWVRDAENFDVAYLAWRKQRAAEHRAKHMAAFARGESPSPRAIEA